MASLSLSRYSHLSSRPILPRPKPNSFAPTKSSAFRMEEKVPLVIPEANPEAMQHIKLGTGKGTLIANRNWSSIICLMAATPLHRRAKVLEGKLPTCNIFKLQYAFNLFSHNASVLSNGYNEEEMKMVKEIRKIWNDKDVKVTATCI
ncbi:hypothetical protein RJT34_04840 [Clitoria ternatea]|uniref:Semialdehyde dehydrogenase dimerisation domain-containing protein n=1 Tax=Clitoria ternatea TaxID=43366 RepID=A0AAN9Q2N0_CLITE